MSGSDTYAPVVLEGMDLAALLCSRVCHDVISPVGAIVNGIELYDSGDASMKEFAIDLVRKSARQAAARLKFARIAFGAAGSAGASIDLGDAAEVAAGFIGDEKISLTWNAPRVLLPKNEVKLLLNLLMLATHAIPRGGNISVNVGVTPTPEGDRGSFTLHAKGLNARIPPHAASLLQGEAAGGVIDAHAVQPYYTGQLARAAGLPVTLSVDGDTVTLGAVRLPDAAQPAP